MYVVSQDQTLGVNSLALPRFTGPPHLSFACGKSKCLMSLEDDSSSQYPFLSPRICVTDLKLFTQVKKSLACNCNFFFGKEVVIDSLRYFTEVCFL